MLSNPVLKQVCFTPPRLARRRTLRCTGSDSKNAAGLGQALTGLASLHLSLIGRFAIMPSKTKCIRPQPDLPQRRSHRTADTRAARACHVCAVPKCSLCQSSAGSKTQCKESRVFCSPSTLTLPCSTAKRVSRVIIIFHGSRNSEE